MGKDDVCWWSGKKESGRERVSGYMRGCDLRGCVGGYERVYERV